MSLRFAEEIIVTTHTPAKAAEVDMGVTGSRKVDPEHGKAVDDGSRHVGYNEESRCRQQEDRADVTEEVTETHGEGRLWLMMADVVVVLESVQLSFL